MKYFIGLCGMWFVANVWSFNCFITIVKDTCWTDYNVTVDVLDADNANQKLVTVIVPTGSAWNRQKFSCKPSQKLKFQARFTPVFWKKDAGKVYNGTNYWILPDKPSPDETAWNLTICYPKQFSEVPFPPTGGGNCKCETKKVPPVPPQ